MSDALAHYREEETSLALIAKRNDAVRSAVDLIMSGKVVLPKHAQEPGAIAALMLTGLELGMQPMEAIRGLHLVNGRVIISADAMLALVMRRGVKVAWHEVSDAKATIEMRRDGSEPLIFTYTIEQAKRAGLAGKEGPWRNHPDAMLRARCVGAAIKMYCPDLLSGAYTPDESEEFRNTERVEEPRRSPRRKGDVIDAEVVQAEVVRSPLHEEFLAGAEALGKRALAAGWLDAKKPTDEQVRRELKKDAAEIERRKAGPDAAADEPGEREPGQEG